MCEKTHRFYEQVAPVAAVSRSGWTHLGSGWTHGRKGLDPRHPATPRQPGIKADTQTICHGVMKDYNRTQLAEDGFTVIPQVIPPEQCGEYGFLHNMRYAAKQFVKDNCQDQIPAHGVFKFHQAGHTGFSWQIRTHSAVQQVFKELWNCQDLITSYDGFCYMPPNLHRRNTNWMHVDQAPNDPAYRCVQGFLCLTDDESFLVAPRSHLKFEQYMAEHQIYHSKPWQKTPEFYQEAIPVKAYAGDLVLWDSRTAHQNRYTSKERIVQYVCMLPRSRATPAQLAKRRKYFEEKRTTSHWPTPIRVNSLQPQVYNDASKLIDYDKIIDPLACYIEAFQDEINKLV